MTRQQLMTPPDDGSGQRALTDLAGVGPRLAERFGARGIHVLFDLWLFLPSRYEDRTRLTCFADLAAGHHALVEGYVATVERIGRSRPMMRVLIREQSGGAMSLCFFHFRPSQERQFVPAQRLRAYGVVKQGITGWEMMHPSYQFLPDGVEVPFPERLDPVYPAIDGVRATTVRKVVAAALDRLPRSEALEHLPASWLRECDLIDFRSAVLSVHFLPAGTDLDCVQEGRHPAQQRLAFEELLAHQLSLRRQRIALHSLRAPALLPRGDVESRFSAQLEFTLTHAQYRVIEAIRKDLAKEAPMMRLVQGDVGCGKTVVAAMAACRCIAHGKQVALIAPTELLAEQHLRNFSRWFEPLGYRVVWLASKVIGQRRKEVLHEIGAGSAQIVIGTHALFQTHVRFHDLAFVIVDEQHRFGVHQRLALRDKGLKDGTVPHQLIMTATPIPRTLAMSAYADLDVSIIDALPPGRTPVKTVVFKAQRRTDLIQRVGRLCREGRQAYWVCTLIEDAAEADKTSPQSEAQSVEIVSEILSQQLPDVAIGLVHGRLPPGEKHRVMQAFKQGELAILVATTVIEVGVDVPNASLMVIENAERLGLAQLHQLRGRVGRGAVTSTCVLLYQGPLSTIARQRLELLRQTNDGFVIAEKDLELRGPGELLGTRQTGLIAFKVANLARDSQLIPKAHAIAERLLATHPADAEAIIQRWIGRAARFAAA